MSKYSVNSEMTLENCQKSTEDMVVSIEKMVTAALNVEADIDKVVSITPKDGYAKKIELISNAEDLSTNEKIAAIDAAENKYASDLEKNAELYQGVAWRKVGTTLACAAGLVLMLTTPEGKKIAKNILKAVS